MSPLCSSHRTLHQHAHGFRASLRHPTASDPFQKAVPCTEGVWGGKSDSEAFRGCLESDVQDCSADSDVEWLLWWMQVGVPRGVSVLPCGSLPTRTPCISRVKVRKPTQSTQSPGLRVPGYLRGGMRTRRMRAWIGMASMLSVHSRGSRSSRVQPGTPGCALLPGWLHAQSDLSTAQECSMRRKHTQNLQ